MAAVSVGFRGKSGGRMAENVLAFSRYVCYNESESGKAGASDGLSCRRSGETAGAAPVQERAGSRETFLSSDTNHQEADKCPGQELEASSFAWGVMARAIPGSIPGTCLHPFLVRMSAGAAAWQTRER